MSLLWKHAVALDDDTYHRDGWVGREGHHEHAMHPSFEAAGIKHSPCAYSICDDGDMDHSDRFDDAEEYRFNVGGHDKVPVHRLDLRTTTLHGFEPNCDLHTLRRYTKHPESRKGLPTVFKYDGEHHIMDGHHGLAAALRRGDSHADVHLIDLDKED